MGVGASFGTEEGTVVGELAAGVLVGDKAGELRDDLGEIRAAMLDAASRAVAEEPAAGNLGSVMLRVTILPPAPMTRPASAPSSAEAP